jgi:hypothetical protein
MLSICIGDFMITAANEDGFAFYSSGASTNFTLRYSDELADKITLLAGQINAAHYWFLKYIAEFDRIEGGRVLYTLDAVNLLGSYFPPLTA